MERPPSLTIVRKVVDVGVVVISSLGGGGRGGGGGGGDIEFVVRFEESRTFFSPACVAWNFGFTRYLRADARIHSHRDVRRIFNK